MAESGEKHRTPSPAGHGFAQDRVITCSNSDVVVTGPDRFVVPYSEVQHKEGAGRQRMAVKVPEVMVKTPK